ncbi:MAG: exodeoxyribonuclease [Patescibacteria group bacterium]|nr:exodeoxyribonuclease [Patescibacteria group bacterium]
MKLISWNVNGFRAIWKKNFWNFVERERPDVLCLQETKISKKVIAVADFSFPGYQVYWHSAQRPGYSGTALLIKEGLEEFINIKNGLGKEEFDDEGRVQVADFKSFYLLNVYFPNANAQLSRLDYKLRFNEFLLRRVTKLKQIKPVIVTGDYNVAHQEIDLARPQENVGNPGFTPEERAAMDRFINSGFIDTFRFIQGEKIKYSWWSYRSAARSRNIGWRIDYFCVSDKLKKRIKRADIYDFELGSDHAPVLLELD